MYLLGRSKHFVLEKTMNTDDAKKSHHERITDLEVTKRIKKDRDALREETLNQIAISERRLIKHWHSKGVI